MFESQALRPLNSELDEGEWPQLQLVDVVVYSQKYGSDNPIDILDVAEKGPFRVKGTLLKVPPKHKGIGTSVIEAMAKNVC